jgi:hypothetical protein
MTSRRLWCRASRTQAGACAWRTATRASACLAVSRTCARCAPANRAQECWRTWTARWPAGARSRRSTPTAHWSDPGRSRTSRTRAPGRWCALWSGRDSGASASCTNCWRARSGTPTRWARRRWKATQLTLAAAASTRTSGYVGTVPLFEAHGFSRVCQTTGQRGGKPRWLVRRELA